MTFHIVYKDKVFLKYGSSNVALNFHLLKMTLYVECKAKVFLLYGSSKFSFKLPCLENTFYTVCKDKFFQGWNGIKAMELDIIINNLTTKNIFNFCLQWLKQWEQPQQIASTLIY